MIIFTCIISFFFAMNIGASGAAATMGISYGSGAIDKKRIALLLCACCILLGALFGDEVAKTLGNGIIPENLISIKIALIILISASSSLFIANLLGIPLSTSEVTVGAVVGVGIAYQSLFIPSIIIIVLSWILVPLLAFIISYLSNYWVKKLEKKTSIFPAKTKNTFLTTLVILTGLFEAFSAGMNNVANAIGPLIASGIFSIDVGLVVGGIFVALGAFLLGGKVMETNGKKITELSLLQGSTISAIGGTLVTISSIFGIPIPQTQITTCSILGIGFSEKGKAIWKKDIIQRILKIWLISPIFSLVFSYTVVKIFLMGDQYSVAIVLCVFVLTVGIVSYLKPFKTKSNVLYKEIKVGGIEND